MLENKLDIKKIINESDREKRINDIINERDKRDKRDREEIVNKVLYEIGRKKIIDAMRRVEVKTAIDNAIGSRDDEGKKELFKMIDTMDFEDVEGEKVLFASGDDVLKIVKTLEIAIDSIDFKDDRVKKVLFTKKVDPENIVDRMVILQEITKNINEYMRKKKNVGPISGKDYEIIKQASTSVFEAKREEAKLREEKLKEAKREEEKREEEKLKEAKREEEKLKKDEEVLSVVLEDDNKAFTLNEVLAANERWIYGRIMRNITAWYDKEGYQEILDYLKEMQGKVSDYLKEMQGKVSTPEIECPEKAMTILSAKSKIIEREDKRLKAIEADSLNAIERLYEELKAIETDSLNEDKVIEQMSFTNKEVG